MIAQLPVIRDTLLQELDWVCATEASAPSGTVLSYSRQRHETEFSRADIRYKTVMSAGELVGYVILALDPGGLSVEFRRIVISKPGHGIGRAVIMLLDDVCFSEFHRSRIWLDVFAENARARFLYEACGYIRFGETKLAGKLLFLYQKEINKN